MAAPIAGIAGPTIVGFWFNLVLTGILIVQVYMYHLQFPRDNAAIKATVYILFALELAQTIMLAVKEFRIYGANFTTPQTINQTHIAWLAIPFMTALNAAIVQIFFGYRIRVLSKMWAPAVVVWILALLQCGAGMAQGILSIHLRMSEIAAKTHSSIAVWLIASAVNDVLIALFLSYFLWNLRTGFKKTDVLLSKLILLVVETGTLTALIAVVTLVLFFANPHPWYIMLTEVIGKVYSNAMMVMLNRRSSSSRGEVISGVNTTGLDLRSASHTENDPLPWSVAKSSRTHVWNDDHDIPMKGKSGESTLA